jgi:hypothetical protein
MTLETKATASLARIAATAALCLLGGAVAAAGPAKSDKPAKAAATKSAKKKAAPAPVEAAPAEATTEQIDAAERVYYGAYECEFNQSVDIERSTKHAAYVNVRNGNSAWVMKPVLSSTGAIRLEDVKGETLMVQIASKSMLLNVKTARRIVDDCISPQQRELVAAAKAAKAAELASNTASPLPLLGGPPVASAAAPLPTATMAPADAASATK